MLHKQVMVSALLLISIAGAATSEYIQPKEEIVIKTRLGSADGEFGIGTYKDNWWTEPSAIAIDSKGNIYVADPWSARIQKFDNHGIFLSKINVRLKKKRFEGIIDDLGVDSFDNLYVLSGHEERIDKYNSDGNLIQSIDLKDKEIVWSTFYKKWMKGADVKSLTVDKFGNIYLRGFQELIKLSSAGEVQMKWLQVIPSIFPSFYIDRTGQLYLSEVEDSTKSVFRMKKNSWKRYDNNGRLLGSVECGDKSLKAYFPPHENDTCNFPPQFIDKNGFIYYFNPGDNKSDVVAIYKFDKHGVLKKYQKPDIEFQKIGNSISRNMIKFDEDGRLYTYSYSDKEFWIKRISF